MFTPIPTNEDSKNLEYLKVLELNGLFLSKSEMCERLKLPEPSEGAVNKGLSSESSTICWV